MTDRLAGNMEEYILIVNFVFFWGKQFLFYHTIIAAWMASSRAQLLIGQCWSRDLDTGLLLVTGAHTSELLVSVIIQKSSS